MCMVPSEEQNKKGPQPGLGMFRDLGGIVGRRTCSNQVVVAVKSLIIVLIEKKIFTYGYFLDQICNEDFRNVN